MIPVGRHTVSSALLQCHAALHNQERPRALRLGAVGCVGLLDIVVGPLKQYGATKIMLLLYCGIKLTLM